MKHLQEFESYNPENLDENWKGWVAGGLFILTSLLGQNLLANPDGTGLGRKSDAFSDEAIYSKSLDKETMLDAIEQLYVKGYRAKSNIGDIFLDATWKQIPNGKFKIVDYKGVNELEAERATYRALDAIASGLPSSFRKKAQKWVIRKHYEPGGGKVGYWEFIGIILIEGDTYQTVPSDFQN